MITIPIDSVFYLMILFVGVDYFISGILGLRENLKYPKKPKLLGLLILKKNQNFFEQARKQNQVFQIIYSHQSIMYMTLIAGLLLIIGSLIQLIDILLQIRH